MDADKMSNGFTSTSAPQKDGTAKLALKNVDKIIS